MYTTAPSPSGPNAYQRGPVSQLPSRLFGGAASRFGSRRMTGDLNARAEGGGGGTYRNSTLLHKGFYDLLAVLTPDARPTSPLSAGTRPDDLAPSPERKTKSPRKPVPAVQPPDQPSSAPSAQPDFKIGPPTGARIDFGGPKKARRISKDQIGLPFNPIHLLHASTHDEAKELLMSWSVEGIGKKLPDQEWARTIKGVIQARALEQQAIAIAHVQAAIQRNAEAADATALHVLNGMPSSAYASTIQSPLDSLPSSLTISTNATVGHDTAMSQLTTATPRGSTLPSPLGRSVVSMPPLPRTNTARSIPLRPLPTVPDVDGLPLSRPTSLVGPSSTKTTPEKVARPPLPARPVVPCMETLEKAAAASIFFETLYHGMLKSATSPQNRQLIREKRRLALERQLEGTAMPEEEKTTARQRLQTHETQWLRDQRKRVGAKNFSRLHIIGHGAFGVVSLVRQKDTQELFAMKQLRKADMLRKCQEGHVRSERDLLAAAASNGGNDGDWIVKLHYSFQDTDNLYLVLDFMGGGDLLNLLVEKDIFPEGFTQFYIAEMVMCLQATHSLGFLHRDVKPDNFLLNKDGHLRISDFGLATDLHWAHDTAYYQNQRQALLKRHGIDLEESDPASTPKKLDRKKAEEIMGGKQGLLTWRDKNRKKLAYSVAGTNSYMAVEVIRGTGYGFSCDWWSLGVIMYECLYGYPPFVSSSRQQTRQKILNWKQHLKFPARPRVSREAIDFLKLLLCEPEDRLGSVVAPTRPNSHLIQERRSGFAQPPPVGLPVDDGASQIKNHPWFHGLDWKNLHLALAPYQPNMSSDADVSHFDADIPDEPLAPAGGAQTNVTKDPILRHRVHGAQMLEVRKQKAFAGFTYKSPRKIAHPSSEGLFDGDSALEPHADAGETSPFLAGSDVAVEDEISLAVDAPPTDSALRSRAISL